MKVEFNITTGDIIMASFYWDDSDDPDTIECHDLVDFLEGCREWCLIGNFKEAYKNAVEALERGAYSVGFVFEVENEK